MNLLTVLLLALTLLLAAGCASSFPSPPPGVDPEHVHFEKAVARVGAPAPDFTLRGSDGHGAVTLSELRGKPVVLVFGSFT